MTHRLQKAPTFGSLIPPNNQSETLNQKSEPPTKILTSRYPQKHQKSQFLSSLKSKIKFEETPDLNSTNLFNNLDGGFRDEMAPESPKFQKQQTGEFNLKMRKTEIVKNVLEAMVTQGYEQGADSSDGCEEEIFEWVDVMLSESITKLRQEVTHLKAQYKVTHTL